MQPPTEGAYLGVDNKAFASESHPANKGYRFIVRTDADQVFWHLFGQKRASGGVLETPPTVEADEMPHPLGYFIHSQADLTFDSVHQVEASAPVLTNGAAPRPVMSLGQPVNTAALGHTIEFVPLSPGRGRVYCTALSGGQNYAAETSFFIHIIEVERDGVTQLEVTFPELVEDQNGGYANEKVDHIFLPEGGEADILTRLRWEEIVTGMGDFRVNSYIAPHGGGRASYTMVSTGGILTRSFEDPGSPNGDPTQWAHGFEATIRVDSGVQFFPSFVRELALVSRIKGDEAGARPGGIHADLQFNRHLSYGTEDGGYRKPVAAFPRGSTGWDYDAAPPVLPDTEDSDTEGSALFFDARDRDLDGEISEAEDNPDITEEDGNGNTYFDHEDWDFSGGGFSQDGDLSAVQSSVLAITVVRPEIVPIDEQGEEIPYWETLETPMFVQANDNDDNLNGVADSGENGFDEDLREASLRLFPRYEKMEEILQATFDGDVKFNSDNEISFVLHQDHLRSASYGDEFIGFSPGNVVHVEAFSSQEDATIEAILRTLVVPGELVESVPVPDPMADPEPNGEVIKLRSIGLDITRVPGVLFSTAEFATPIEYRFLGIPFEAMDPSKRIYNQRIVARLVNRSAAGDIVVPLGEAVINPRGQYPRIVAHPSTSGPNQTGSTITSGNFPDNGMQSAYTCFVPSSTWRESGAPENVYVGANFQLEVAWARDADADPSGCLVAKSPMLDDRSDVYQFYKGVAHAVDMGIPSDGAAPAVANSISIPLQHEDLFWSPGHSEYVCVDNPARVDDSPHPDFEFALQEATPLGGLSDSVLVESVLINSGGWPTPGSCDSYVNRTMGYTVGFNFFVSYPGYPKNQPAQAGGRSLNQVLPPGEFGMDTYSVGGSTLSAQWLGDQAQPANLTIMNDVQAGTGIFSQQTFNAQAWVDLISDLGGVAAGLFGSSPLGAVLVSYVVIIDILDAFGLANYGVAGTASSQFLSMHHLYREVGLPNGLSTPVREAVTLQSHLWERNGVFDRLVNWQVINEPCRVGDEIRGSVWFSAATHAGVIFASEARTRMELSAPDLLQVGVTVDP